MSLGEFHRTVERATGLSSDEVMDISLCKLRNPNVPFTNGGIHYMSREEFDLRVDNSLEELDKFLYGQGRQIYGPSEKLNDRFYRMVLGGMN